MHNTAIALIEVLKAYRARLLKRGKIGDAVVVQKCIDLLRDAQNRVKSAPMNLPNIQ